MNTAAECSISSRYSLARIFRVLKKIAFLSLLFFIDLV